MVKKIIKSYYELFDKKIKNSIIVIGLIGLIIFSIGSFRNPKESNNKISEKPWDMISINGKVYKLAN